MDILVTRPDAALTKALEAAGHHVTTWNPAEPPPAAHVAIIHGLAEVTPAASASALHLLAVLEPNELAAAGGRGNRLSDFALKTAEPAELVARVQRLCARPSHEREQINDLLVLAVERTSDVVEVSTPAAVLQFVNPSYETTLGIP